LTTGVEIPVDNLSRQKGPLRIQKGAAANRSSAPGLIFDTRSEVSGEFVVRQKPLVSGRAKERKTVFVQRDIVMVRAASNIDRIAGCGHVDRSLDIGRCGGRCGEAIGRDENLTALDSDEAQ